ncbi:UPF0046 protein C25E10.12 [Ditylenchus destructor]|nr:UPF0046 protein C25E10.12 [Ditylenchus destructor]
MGTLPHPHKIVIAGNHELGWDETEDVTQRQEPHVNKPGSPQGYKLLTNCAYLHDSSIEVHGITVYGSSWHPLPDYPFFRERGPALHKEWLKIPIIFGTCL